MILVNLSHLPIKSSQKKSTEYTEQAKAWVISEKINPKFRNISLMKKFMVPGC